VGRGGPRDLAAIRDGLAEASRIRAALTAGDLGPPPDEIPRLVDAIGEHSALVDRLARALAADLPAQSRDGVFAPFRSWRKCRRANERTDQVLEDLALDHLADQTAANLSYGDLALLELGLAAATDPKLMLLDEPVCGMGPAETEHTVAKIQELAGRIDVVIIEHDIEVVFNIADQITVMANGAVLASGTPDEISNHSEVRAAYLGEEDDDA